MGGVRRLALGSSLLLLAAVGHADELEWHGSATSELRYYGEKREEKSDDLSGFYDQYQFLRNKDASGPFELGLSELRLDALGEEETPVLLLRFRSPASDVSLGGGGLDLPETFLTQRGELLGRFEGIDLDLDYRRSRVDELRVFPDPTDPTGALGFTTNASRFNNLTDADDRFYNRRSRIASRLRLRPDDLLPGADTVVRRLFSEVTLRGRYEERAGRRQGRSVLDFTDIGVGGGPRSLWNGVTTRQDQRISGGGGELVLTPGGGVTLALDFDHERFRENADTLFQTDLNALNPGIGITTAGAGTFPDQIRSLRTYLFVPDTDRTTGTARFQTRLGDRGGVHGAFQMTTLAQEGDRTPFQELVGMRGNKVQFYSGNLAADFRLTRDLSANAFFRFDQRRNRIPRGTTLYSPLNGTQVDSFLKRVRTVKGGAELVYRLHRLSRVALGTRGEWTDRKLDFARPPPFTDAILSQNALVDDETRVFSVYTRTVLVPRSGLHLSGEFGYRNAPDTGYITELDDVLYGEGRLSYTPSWKRPVTLSLFARGESGENDDFEQVGAASGNRNRDFERERYAYGATVSGSPRKGLTLFGSLFAFEDSQDFDLIRSTVRRFREPFSPVSFFVDTPLDYRSDVAAAILGATVLVAEGTDVTLSYSFTRSHMRFESRSASQALLDGVSRVRSDIHGVELEVGHQLRRGLRIHTRYRFDNYRDRTPVNVRDFNPSTRRHTAVLGITLDTDLLD